MRRLLRSWGLHRLERGFVAAWAKWERAGRPLVVLPPRPPCDYLDTVQALVTDQTILVDATAGPITVNLISSVWTPNTYTVKRNGPSAVVGNAGD